MPWSFNKNNSNWKYYFNRDEIKNLSLVQNGELWLANRIVIARMVERLRNDVMMTSHLWLIGWLETREGSDKLIWLIGIKYSISPSSSTNSKIFRIFWNFVENFVIFFYASGSNILSISSSIVSSEYFMYLLTLDTFKIVSNDSTLDDESFNYSHTQQWY